MKQTEESNKPLKGLAFKHIVILSILFSLFIVSVLILYETKTSWFQARYFSKKAAACQYSTDYGESSEIRFPRAGPFNRRLGYTMIPSFLETLTPQGFEIERQATWSTEMIAAVDNGLNPIYKEKKRLGYVFLM